ncbi:hypothetical protein MSAS_04710 [Mycobacterium saskatchewanense]|uniref:DUF732 domain-containing protein n=1 Tax=Mycobacterium saskatchewanense TaxID=220927 RepID=A0AAJ3NNM3_9MYCO|nr:DUF732 domain-containing protein [Mycobacterium saskatchewanense]ORW70265.1 hypothetical protein AWC23_18765 [Mycobacterium saskatchewanense]BBX61297.1 hypothetical protein MSAS_04710 [Mycobacterium saskatchewanense]
MRLLGATAWAAGVTAALAPPVHADLMGNAFLRALTNAGVPVSQPDTTMALGQRVCPLLVAPGGSFDAVVASTADAAGMSESAAGAFTVVAIATYCPAVLAPLLSNRLPG